MNTTTSRGAANGFGLFIGRVVALFELIPYSLIALLARVVVGLVFLNSGLTKVDDNWQVNEATIYLFQNDFKVPLISPWLAAHLAAYTELTMPWLLFAGLAARFATLPLLAMTLVIEVFVFPEAYVTHGLWAVSLLLILTRGAGVLSLDYLIKTWWQQR